MVTNTEQPDLFETAEARTLLDQLLTDSRLYTQTKDYKNLLDFVVKLRNFAPFNAMLLQIQKPGLTYAASAKDWRERFNRTPKPNARPLLILWPFGPVAFVYDVMDTEGDPLPEDVATFFAHGLIDTDQINDFIPLVKKNNIQWCWMDAGDGNAGGIKVIRRADKDNKYTLYRIDINRNHEPAVQFVSLTHELAHLFLGHLGPDKVLRVPERPQILLKQRELESESVAYLVCARNGIKSKSETYLKFYVDNNTTIDNLDIYNIMRAAGQIESMLGLTFNTKFDKHIVRNKRI
jgi:hypothetical protein